MFLSQFVVLNLRLKVWEAESEVMQGQSPAPNADSGHSLKMFLFSNCRFKEMQRAC